MKIMVDTGDILPDLQVGTRLDPSYKNKIRACSVWRSEIVLFVAKGGIWFEYARYFREFLFKNNTQNIFIDEDK